MARMTARPMKSGQQITDNWIAGMQSPTAQSKYKAAVSAVAVSPMELAASPEATAKYLRNVQESVTNGKRQANLRNADFGNWKTVTSTIGATNLGAGAVKKRAKMLSRMNRMAPIYNQASQAAATVPDDGGMNLGKVQAALAVLKASKGQH